MGKLGSSSISALVPPSMWSDNGGKLVYLVFAGTILVMYNLLIQIARLKYQGTKVSPFETHSVLMNTSVVTFSVAGFTSMALCFDYFRSSTTIPFSPAIYNIIKIVFCISAVLAHVSLVLILFAD